MKPLAPGRCEAPPRRLTRADLDALATTPAPHRFSPTSRAGFLERALWPEPGPNPAQTTFVAVVDTLDAAHVLALAARGAVGFLIEDQPPERHAIVLAIALGLPMATGTLPTPEPPALTLDQPGVAPSIALPPNAIRVLPLTLFPAAPTTPHHIELIGAQPEERLLARRALEQGRATGVGLIRLEVLFMADPGLDLDGLTDHLAILLTDLPDWPVAIRLTDWSDAKPPPGHGELQSWNGQPGIAGLIDTPALALQTRALRDAAKRARHPQVWCLAPHTQRPAHAAALRPHLGPVKLGGVIESSKPLNQLNILEESLDGIWIGCGDLSESLETGDTLSERLSSAARTTRHPLHICG